MSEHEARIWAWALHRAGTGVHAIRHPHRSGVRKMNRREFSPEVEEAIAEAIRLTPRADPSKPDYVNTLARLVWVFGKGSAIVAAAAARQRIEDERRRAELPWWKRWLS